MTNRVDFDELEWDEDQVALAEGAPFTGEVLEHDSEGRLIALINYTNGFKDGKETHYYPDGTVAFEGTWQRGAGGVGVHRAYHADGQLKEEAYYDDRGHLQRVERFSDNGGGGAPAG